MSRPWCILHASLNVRARSAKHAAYVFCKSYREVTHNRCRTIGRYIKQSCPNIDCIDDDVDDPPTTIICITYAGTLAFV